MKEKMRKLELFSFYDYSGIGQHLEEMAKKGWMIEKIGNFGWIYQRIEPQSIHFSVTYYPKASDFDPQPSEEQKIFYEFCQRTGWELVCEAAQMQVFCNRQENPTPLETDPQTLVQTVQSAAKKNFLPSNYLLLAISVLNMALWIARVLSDPVRVLASTTALTCGVSYCLLFFVCLSEICSFYTWQRKAKKAAEQGVFFATRTSSWIKKRANFFIVLLIMGLWLISTVFSGNNILRVSAFFGVAYVLLVIFFSNSVKQFLKKKNVSRSTNLTVTIVSIFVIAFLTMFFVTRAFITGSSKGIFQEARQSADEPVLVMEDLMDGSFEGYIREQSGNDSIFLRQISIRQHAPAWEENVIDIGTLEYTITYVKMPFLYDFCKKGLIEKRKDDVKNGEVVFTNHYEAIDPAPWNALEAYQLHWSTSILQKYILCYSDYIVEIQFLWEHEPKVQQIQLAGEKLSGRKE